MEVEKPGAPPPGAARSWISPGQPRSEVTVLEAFEGEISGYQLIATCRSWNGLGVVLSPPTKLKSPNTSMAISPETSIHDERRVCLVASNQHPVVLCSRRRRGIEY